MSGRLRMPNNRELERIHLLRTLVNYGPMTGLELVERANVECDHPWLEQLPELSRRGMGQKLNALSLDGFVIGRNRRSKVLSERVMVWAATDLGRMKAASLPEQSR